MTVTSMSPDTVSSAVHALKMMKHMEEPCAVLLQTALVLAELPQTSLVDKINYLSVVQRNAEPQQTEQAAEIAFNMLSAEPAIPYTTASRLLEVARHGTASVTEAAGYEAIRRSLSPELETFQRNDLLCHAEGLFKDQHKPLALMQKLWAHYDDPQNAAAQDAVAEAQTMLEKRGIAVSAPKAPQAVFAFPR